MTAPTSTTAEPTGPAPAGDAPGPAGRRWVDPLVALLCTLAAVAAYLPRGFEGLLTRDLGVYAYGGQQLLDGDLPYEAVVNRAGPLAQALPGLGAWLGRLLGADSGADDVVAMRALYLCFAAVSVGLAYLVGTRVFRSRHAGVVAAGALLSFGGFVELATYGPREKTPMVMFVLAALLAAAHRRWWAAGCLVALATLTWQPAFVAAIVAVAAVALVGPGTAGRLGALLRVAGGGVLATALVAAAYVANGSFDVLLEGFWGINAGYAGADAMVDDLPNAWRSLRPGYGWSVYALLAGLLGALAQGVRAGLSGGPGDRAAVLGIGVGAAAAVAWTLNAFNAWPDAFPVLPFAAVGLGGLAALLAATLSRWSAAAPWPAVVATAALAAAGAGHAVTFGLATHDDELVVQREAVTAALAELPEGSELVSVGAPAALVLAGSDQEARVQLFSPPVEDWLEATWPGGLGAYGQGLLATEPAAVVTERKIPAWFRPMLREDYVRVERVTNMTWWVDRDLRDRVDAVREALLSAPATGPEDDGTPASAGTRAVEH